MAEIAVREYLTSNARSPYQNWFNTLPESTAARVAIAILRLEEGNLSNVKGVGEGVFECRINWGPGYRMYFGKDGDTVVILLGGSSKQRQTEAIPVPVSIGEITRRGRRERGCSGNYGPDATFQSNGESSF